MTRLCFVDTETSGLHPGRRAWEVAVIVRDPGHEDDEHQWFVDLDDLDLGNADPRALDIGRFHERHPNAVSGERYIGDTHPERWVMGRVEFLTRRAIVLGSVPSFDTDVLGRRMRAHGLCPVWHYRPEDVISLAAGFLRGRGEQVAWPYSSDEISRRVGVEPPDDVDRHTALGDCRWAARVFDALGFDANATELAP